MRTYDELIKEFKKAVGEDDAACDIPCPACIEGRHALYGCWLCPDRGYISNNIRDYFRTLNDDECKILKDMWAARQEQYHS